MQNPQLADFHVSLSGVRSGSLLPLGSSSGSRAIKYRRRTTREERRVLGIGGGGAGPINSMATRSQKNAHTRTGSFLDIVPGYGGGGLAAGDVRDLEHGHRAVEQAVHDLEAGGLVAPDRGGVPDVARLALARGVLEHDVGRLEYAQRERVRAVLADRLEQARQERRAHDLELERLGVRDLHRGLVVGRVEPRKVFFVGALLVGGCVIRAEGARDGRRETTQRGLEVGPRPSRHRPIRAG